MALLDRPLRANPALELVLFDRLQAGERRLLAGLERDPDHYGVLRPPMGGRGAGLGLKAVDRETALLFLTLARPGPLPAYVRSRLGDAMAARALARLVADGVLEIESEPGTFVSGAAAMALFAAGAAASGRPTETATCGPLTATAAFGRLPETAACGRFTETAACGRLAELSRAALRYGQELARTQPAVEPVRLSLRLYGYHRLPLTPRWLRVLSGPGAVRRHLGIAAGGPARDLLERHWRPLAPAGAEPWMRWQPAAPRLAGPAGAVTYKLYVSPAPEALPNLFATVLDGFAAVGSPGFKVGATAGGLLRPDKIVAYFTTFERLAQAAAALAERLAGVAAHGVPFTSEIAAGGLLSWGVDPPNEDGFGPFAGDGRMSWRLWLTHRLARALISGAAAAAGEATAGEAAMGEAATADAAGGDAMEPWRFALERLRLEGIDTDSWTPGGGLWQGQGEQAWR
ncbi:MAG TPA: hypothetical protein VMW75_02405 [Thermoanaerobaculia bacterium]|nr:hypothetical protein [Thermoanaerobaculia bacterium]